jgi:hypothetical protein
MVAGETDLEMTRRHVAQGERHVADQRKVVDHLRKIGGDTDMASQLLEEFEATLEDHRDHRNRLEAEARDDAAGRRG